MISPFSIRAHAAEARAAAYRAIRFAAAMGSDDRSEHENCARQLRAAARELIKEADLIEAKVKAGETGNALANAAE